ncbi:hypothetical protein FRC0190_02331 [Corynebacterium rouxii]|uniref:Uncharacterized protein n=1 Tax=Corynebacterium rouxii TaxID=2719119 RepID=A0A6I8MII6_9CORY|nr:hypothetical protein FRC0190_02331 [Corynebacterium rouxii]
MGFTAEVFTRSKISEYIESASSDRNFYDTGMKITVDKFGQWSNRFFRR